MRNLISVALLGAAACGLNPDEAQQVDRKITVADQMSSVVDNKLFVELSDAAGICGHEQQAKVKGGSKRLTFEFGDKDGGAYTVWNTAETQPSKWVKVTFERFDATCTASESGAATGTVTLTSATGTVAGNYDVTFNVLGGTDQKTGSISAAACDLSGAAGGSTTCL